MGYLKDSKKIWAKGLLHIRRETFTKLVGFFGSIFLVRVQMGINTAF